jgi:hypothetical protein
MIGNIAGNTEIERISQELNSPNKLKDVEYTPKAGIIKID